ncbi:DNA primase [Flexibacter flexilis DSM 6793]|uniref:DNA primase n=1 Tax=Flexibacter flexilis DSM 6793 TaxID=927664 RepID=A0A1I1MSG3_9BACT|nr:DNA primase [Flexibacter flexilis]SFC87862.1 DNA primase [Flexibacter flexilis DSM 6793]
MRISQETVERIQQTADIIEVIGDFVPLKKKGKDYTACCPFHNEKTPSFYVSPAKGIYKCFGCGKAGDTIRFVMDIESLNYGEALRYLAKKYGIEIEEDAAPLSAEQQQAQSERESIFIALNFAKNFYANQLSQHPDGQALGLTYLRERGFLDKTIQAFELGYSSDTWDGLLQAAKKQGFTADILEKSGLLIRRDDGREYDRFRGRVMFPIHNTSGKVIGFGARILGSDKNQPKYINSPETEVYNKSEVLFGLFQAKNAIRQADNCYLAEGYTDVISLHQAGVANVVASSGTSLTAEQIQLIKRYTHNVTVLYDGDWAGIKASLRGIDMLLEAGLNVRAITFPDGDDPDSYLRKVGGSAFTAYLQTAAKDFISFKASLFAEDAARDPIRKAEIIRDIVQSISLIPDLINRSVFLKQCSQLLGVEEEILLAESNKIILKKQQQQNPTHRPAVQAGTQIPAPQPSPEMLDEQAFLAETQLTPDGVSRDKIGESIRLQERETMRFLLQYAAAAVSEEYKLGQYALAQLEDIVFVTPLYSRMIGIFREEMAKNHLPDYQFFVRYSDEEIRQEAASLIAERHELSESWFSMHHLYTEHEKDNLAYNAYKQILRLKAMVVKKLVNEKMQQIIQAEQQQATAETVEKLLMEYQVLHKLGADINKELGTVIK